MSAAKTSMSVASLAFALIFGGGVFLYMNLGSIAKSITERIATDTLGVSVSISRMDISLKEKTVTVGGLRIANPKGFEKPYAMVVDRINVALVKADKELVHFKDIAVTGTDINLEVRDGGTNLHAIKNNVKTPAPAPKTEGAAEEQVKVIIDRLAITQAQLNPSVVLFEQQDLQSVVVSDIILTGIGQRENGVLAREAIAQVWNGISRAVNKSANNAGFLQGLSPDAMKEMGMSQVQQFKDKFKEDIDGLGKSIGNLFGGN